MPEETAFPNPWALDPRIRRTGDTYYFAGELLVADPDMREMNTLLGPLRTLRTVADDPLAGIVTRVAVPAGDDGVETDLPALVSSMRGLARGGPRVGLNHAFAANSGAPITGQPKLHGGLATEPLPVPEQPTAAGATECRPVRVAVVDTGLDPAALTMPVFGRPLRHGVHELDQVYLDSATRRIGLMGGHGTAAAGVVARYARHCVLMSVQVLSVHGITDEVNLAAGILRARDAGAEIISMSLGGVFEGDTPPLALELVLDSLPAETVVVAAAGNVESATPNFYPASRDGVISVAAVDTTGAAAVPAGFSNTGNWITVCAPGVRVHLPYVTGTWDHGPQPLTFAGQVAWSGTSFATPYVAARIAAATSAGQSCRDAADILLKGLPDPFPGYGRYLEAPGDFTYPAP
ncbi:S8 family peptidase [Actinoplanes derwentensis]|uniref:Subtilase family protein n=1 Tax=Actinoplanes derwentensis TaxID=113562 RepID=A0A1H1WWZ5_9ACTN|nr:S8/S53 family peptidase [Actinoplanes derwentensis]GID86965.1 hypothetical protein Ade03nite_58890 [Actinoplanes derwentensis]SDT00876.1 Subtilase family protein [Actinoplanes derwentensis]